MSVKEGASSNAAVVCQDAAGRWQLLRGDEQRVVGSWQELCAFCTSADLLPELLFFESSSQGQ
jgi:hypothetical protein